MLFERKKIQTETLGEYLKEIRQQLGLSVEAVAKKTQIKAKFLELLENGNLAMLPPDVYVLGFLRKLSQLYHVEVSLLIEQYKKEQAILLPAFKATEAKTGPARAFSNLIITPKILSVLLGVGLVLITMGYIIWQVYSINRAPSLSILQPQQGQVVRDSFLFIKGQTDPGMNVSVNGQDVFVNNNGAFQTQIGITPGPRELIFMAKNKFGKTTTKNIGVLAQSSTTTSTPTTELLVKLDFSGPVTLTYVLDNTNVQSLPFQAGDSKLLIAQKKILISTTDAGATRVTLNGQSLGALGRPKEQLANIPFFAENQRFGTESQ